MNDNDQYGDKVKRIKGPTIRLFGGTYFDFLDPEGSEFTIEDVAHALAHICRFNGHANFLYSVAQHSVLASCVVEKGYELDALLHDSPEAFLGDVTKPLKILLPDFKVIEDRIEPVVLGRFGARYPLPPAVKKVDLEMLVAEQAQVMGAQDDHWDLTFNAKAAPVKITYWPPEYAKEQFLKRYRQLIELAKGIESPYVNLFESWSEVQKQFDMEEPEPDEVFLATYEYEDYSGAAHVFYRRGDDYFEAYGSHCSCYGLEGQWEPEKYDRESFIAMLRKRSDWREGPSSVVLRKLGVGSADNDNAEQAAASAA